LTVTINSNTTGHVIRYDLHIAESEAKHQ